MSHHTHPNQSHFFFFFGYVRHAHNEIYRTIFGIPILEPKQKKGGGGGTIYISEELHLALAMTKTYREKVIDVHYA